MWCKHHASQHSHTGTSLATTLFVSWHSTVTARRVRLYRERLGCLELEQKARYLTSFIGKLLPAVLNHKQKSSCLRAFNKTFINSFREMLSEDSRPLGSTDSCVWPVSVNVKIVNMLHVN